MKKIKLIALLLVSMVLLSAKSSDAQNTTFKLSDYKNPNYLYQSLDLNFGFYNRIDSYNHSGYSKSSTSSFDLNSQAGAVYRRYVNSQNAQGDLRISFNGSIGTRKGNSNYSSDTYKVENNTKSSGHSESIDIVGLHRFYNQKQNFIEVNGRLLISDQGNSYTAKYFSSDTATISDETKRKDFDNTISGSFLVGKGRIEQVQDARMALYLLDDLTVLNRENRPVSDEDVNNLAQLITKLKYRRFFDDRLRKIAEITAIDSFMQKKGIVNTADAAYFTSLNDNWEYANNPIRGNGHRLYTGLEASFGYNYQNVFLENKIPDDRIRETTSKDKIAVLNMVLGYLFEKPTSRRSQNFANIKGSIGIYQHFINSVNRIDPNPVIETNSYSEKVPTVNLSGDYGFGYYPNSRTWLTFRWWLDSGWDKVMEGETKGEKKDLQNIFYTNTGPQLQAYYYLSAKLRLSFSFNGQFSFGNYKYTSEIHQGTLDKETTKSWSQTVNAALTYSLF